MVESKFKIYPARDGWRWRLRDGNNKIIAEGGEAYKTLDGAKRAVANVAYEAPRAVVVMQPLRV